MSVAIVGCGYWGRNLVRNFHQLESLAAICEETESGRDVARGLAPGVPLVPSIDHLELADFDAIVIATPAESHFKLAKWALESDKDVFVEKPLALTYKEGESLVRLAQDRRRILMVGHVMEYHPAVARLNDLVQSGELGELYYIHSNRLSLGKVRREENILWSFAPHDIAIILRLVGSLPVRVAASGGAFLRPDIADVTNTSLEFKNGVRAHIHVSWLHPFKDQRLVVVGSRKMAGFDDVAKRLELFDRRVEINEGEPVPVRGDGVIIPFADDEPLRLECLAFLEAVRERRPPISDGASGLRVLRVLDAAQRSLSGNGLPMDIDCSTAGEATRLSVV